MFLALATSTHLCFIIMIVIYLTFEFFFTKTYDTCTHQTQGYCSVSNQDIVINTDTSKYTGNLIWTHLPEWHPVSKLTLFSQRVMCYLLLFFFFFLRTNRHYFYFHFNDAVWGSLFYIICIFIAKILKNISKRQTAIKANDSDCWNSVSNTSSLTLG